MTFARYVARSFAGHLAILVVAAVLVVLAGAPLFDDVTLRPSPWIAGAPLGIAAALWTARRMRQRGEDTAMAAAGASRVRVALPAVGVATLFQLALCISGDRSERAVERVGSRQAFTAVDGSLLVVSDAASFEWRAGAPVPVMVRGSPGDTVRLPVGFVPEPRDRARLRRQLLVVGTPFDPSSHPLDPMLLRWAWLIAGVIGVWTALGAERAGARRLAFSPLLLVALGLI